MARLDYARASRRRLLVGLVLGAGAATASFLIGQSLMFVPTSHKVILLAYYRGPPPPPPSERGRRFLFDELTNGDPAKNWPDYSLFGALYGCKIGKFRQRTFDPDSAENPGTIGKAIVEIPIDRMTSEEMSCISRLIDPPHVMALLVNEGEVSNAVEHLRANVP